MTSETRKRILSGLQRPHNLHIGRYAGWLRNWVRRQDERDNCALLPACQIS